MEHMAGMPEMTQQGRCIGHSSSSSSSSSSSAAAAAAAAASIQLVGRIVLLILSEEIFLMRVLSVVRMDVLNNYANAHE